jgi:hypothetical protein
MHLLSALHIDLTLGLPTSAAFFQGQRLTLSGHDPRVRE